MIFRVLASSLIVASGAQAQDLPIFDAHIHYSHDAVEQIPPKQAVELLRQAGVTKALVSSSDDDGTQKLYALAPDIVVPALRPYRRRGEIGTWMNDPTVIDYVEARLAENTYFALGEFHAYGDDIQTDVLQRLIALASQYNLLLHAHSDAKAIEQIFETDPDAIVLWAHSGFARPEDVRALLRKHENLWSDLAFRSDQATGGRVDPAWLELFREFPTRFMVGTDTFAPERWYDIADHAAYSREWLDGLDVDLARNIGYANAMSMLAAVQARR